MADSKSHPHPLRLPVNPSQEHLRKSAKRLALDRHLQLTEAQRVLARQYGAKSWAELMHIVETMSRGADQLVSVKRNPEPLPAFARNRDLPPIWAILQSGKFTQHDLDAALAQCCWYSAPDADGNRLRFEIAHVLLKHGADPNGQYGSAYGPIVLGTGECLDIDGLRFLIHAGADVSLAPIETKYGQASPLISVLSTYGRGRNDAKHQIIDLLLQHHAILPPILSPAELAIHRGDTTALNNLLQDDPSLLTRTFPQMQYGNMALAGATLAHCAVEFGEMESLELLLSRGADINAKAELLDGIGGQTPLFHAVATCGGGNLYSLEHLRRHHAHTIDTTIAATFRLYSKPHTPAMTALEYAEKAANSTDTWRQTDNRELALLREIAIS